MRCRWAACRLATGLRPACFVRFRGADAASMSRSANPSDRSGAGGYRPSRRDRWVGAGSATTTLALLALILMLAPAVIAPQAEQQPLRLFDVIPDRVATPEPEPEAAPPRPEPRKPAPSPALVSPSPPAAASQASATEPAASLPSDLAPLAAPSASVPVLPQPGARPSPGRVREPAPESANVRDTYANALWSHINTRRPRGIRMRGETSVAFTVDRRGAVRDVSLSRSSGNPLLDRLALRTVTRAAPMPAPPARLADTALRFTIAVRFD
ncbi:MAG: hypothetical protein CMN73_04095 [Sphingomonas sp.]|nr:hypothetical protein [Sphingomonas sp.]